MASKANIAKGLPQASFTAGELSPLLYGRIDFEQYYKGLRTCRNFIITKYGGADNRPGNEFVSAVDDSTKKHRGIAFTFNNVQQYGLVFGDYTMQIVKDGALLNDDSHSVLIVSTPWAATDLFMLKFTQSADVLTVCHPDYPTYQIERLSDTVWQVIAFANINGPFQDINIDETILIGASATTGTVTLVSSKAFFTPDMVGLPFYLQSPFDMSTPPWQVDISITAGDIVIWGVNYYQALTTGKTGTIPPTVTEGTQQDGHTGIVWQYLHSGSGIVLITAYSDPQHVTAVVQSINPGQQGYLPSLVVTATPGAPPLTISALGLNSPGAAEIDTTTPHGLVAGDQILITGSYHGIADGYWLVLNVTSPTAFTIGIYAGSGSSQPGGGTVTPLTGTYLWALPAWGMTAQGYPATTCYFQNRQLFGATNGQPAVFWGSRSNEFYDNGVGNPALDDDAITYKILSDRANVIKHFLNLQYLLILTSGGIWMVQNGNSGQTVLTGTGTLDLSWQGENPACDVPPLKINNFGLFVSELGNEVRTLGYSFAENAFVGTDITIMSHHLLEFNQIVDWTYQRNPYSCIWAIRDDGELLGCTFFPEQQINAWHHHDTQGTFESTWCVIENNVNVVYFIVNRTLNGQTVRCIERMAPRQFKDPKDAYFLDCALAYDGRPSTPATHFSGASHLAGMTVSVHADGFVLSPFVMPDNGEFDLDNPALVVHVGLAYTSDFETLDISSMKSDIRDKEKLINSVSLIVDQTSGLLIGPDADHLKPYKQKRPANYGEADALLSELVDLNIPCGWNKKGRIFIRQAQPLPCSILAVIPQLMAGGN
jgi:hypothetical protein